MLQLEEEGINRVKMFVIITLAYLIFWGPLFIVTLANISLDWKDAKSSVAHEVNTQEAGSWIIVCCVFSRCLFMCRLFMQS